MMEFGLFLRSMMVLGLLFALLFAVGMAALYVADLDLSYAVVFAVGMLLLQYAIGPFIIQWIYRIEWIPVEGLSPRLQQFVQSCCRGADIPVPRFGIIHDGNPNAFTFGHYPGNARVVVTSGLLDVLDDDEQEAVVAHELGHIAHWDFVVMTVAAIVPLLLYLIFRLGFSGRRSRGKGAGAIVLVAIAAFIAWKISEYIVLLLSRTREYYADSFSARRTQNPNSLATSLVKIAYGLAAAPKVPATESEERQERRPAFAHADAARALGIFDAGMASSLALAAAGQSYATASEEHMVDAMKWDVWNPWGLFYEIHSSHPLAAKRIQALDRQAERMGQKPAYDFPAEPPESYWDEFVADLIVYLYPAMGLLLGGAAAAAVGTSSGSIVAAVGCVLFFLGLGSLLRTKSVHPTRDFPEANVAGLVGAVKVSRVRSVPCVLHGKIIGRGIPGLFWSEDLVLHDGSGFIVLDYRQPIGLAELLFGLFRAEQFVGQDVRVMGWYRRGPRPFLEVWRLWPESDGVQTCWNYTTNLVLGGVATVLGAILALGGLAATL